MKSEGYTVTHTGGCGACSSLQDLGVYMSQNLTTPTRLCGAAGALFPSLEWKCMQKLGFSEMCYSIWHWNIKNTKQDCFLVSITIITIKKTLTDSQNQKINPMPIPGVFS